MTEMAQLMTCPMSASKSLNERNAKAAVKIQITKTKQMLSIMVL